MAVASAWIADRKAASRSPPPHPTAGAFNPQGRSPTRRRVTLCFTPQNPDNARPVTVAAAPDATDGGSIFSHPRQRRRSRLPRAAVPRRRPPAHGLKPAPRKPAPRKPALRGAGQMPRKPAPPDGIFQRETARFPGPFSGQDRPDFGKLLARHTGTRNKSAPQRRRRDDRPRPALRRE